MSREVTAFLFSQNDKLKGRGYMKFKIFVGSALVVIILLQAAIAGMLAYGGIKVRDAVNSTQSTLNNKSTSLTQDTNDINKNLQQANKNLQNITTELKQSPSASQLLP
jgi:predicted PurR-regulated permease PerM